MPQLIAAIVAMCGVVALSNYLVQFPVTASIGPLLLADLLTWAAFTYPVAFLVTDWTNRQWGPKKARIVVAAGFVLAVVLSVWLATPRIAIASGTAFLLAQMLDVSLFDRLRHGKWWRAPFWSSLTGSVLDTAIFFSLAFAATFTLLGANDEFAIANAPLLGVFSGLEAPRWVSWAMGDLAVKLLMTGLMLVPYGLLHRLFKPSGQLANT